MANNKKVFFEFLYIIREEKNGRFTWWELVKFMKKRGANLMLAPGWWVQDWIESAKMRGELIEVAPKEYVFSEYLKTEVKC